MAFFSIFSEGNSKIKKRKGWMVERSWFSILFFRFFLFVTGRTSFTELLI